MKALPGFRDFLPDQCAARNYIFARWREVARRYGFLEWEGPVLEPTELYKKKSGAEIVDQLFKLADPVFALLKTGGKSEKLDKLVDGLRIRGLADFVAVDVGIVRGLAYYTGIVFEVFDRAGKFRAIAGGGRYDNLIQHLSDGAVSMPALGFAMGDVVLGEVIKEIPRAHEAMQKADVSDRKIDIYVVIAKEERRANALTQIQQLRDRGYRVDYPLTTTKVARQFQAAEDAGAALALLYGDEWPQVKVKNMATGEQQLVPQDRLLAHLQAQSSLSS